MRRPYMVMHARRQRGLTHDPIWLQAAVALEDVINIFLHNLIIFGRAIREAYDFQRGQCPHCVAQPVGHRRRYELRAKPQVHKFSCNYIHTPSQWHNFIWR